MDIWRYLDTVLTAVRNLLTGYGLFDFLGMQARPLVGGLIGILILWAISQIAISFYLETGEDGPSDMRMLVQALISGAYIFSPVDLILDPIPLLGQLDDVGIGALFVIALVNWLSSNKPAPKQQGE